MFHQMKLIEGFRKAPPFGRGTLLMTTLKTVFGCDLRSLALFRIGLGLAFLLDLASRARDLRAHYTYFGVLPEPTGPESLLKAIAHLLIGTTWFQTSLFLFGGLMALCLVVGYKTRLVTIICWGLLVFIQFRNWMVLQGGDNLFLLLFFWSMFLPLGARFSFDAAVNQQAKTDSSHAYFSTGTIAILLQVACLYFFSALLKTSPEWLPDGTALYYAMHMFAFVLPTGEWLLNFPRVLQGLTYFTWVLEIIGPFLLFSPWFFLHLRLGMVASFGLLHLGIVAFMAVGIFPFVNLASLVLFIPSWCWDRLTPLLQTPTRQGLTIFYDGDCEFCRKMCLLLKTFLVLPDARILPAQEHPPVFDIMERENTWVVQDVQGRQHTRWYAVVLLISLSPLWWPVACILNRPILHSLGTKIYGSIALNRGRLSQFFRLALPYHRLELRPPLVIEWVVGLLALYMVFINLTTMPQMPFPLSDPIPIVKSTIKLDQKWNMYAPHPRKYDGWFVMPGRLIDGTEVDVFNHRMQAPQLDDSTFAEYPYPSYRWRKYLQEVAQKEHEEQRENLGGYLCREWNASHEPLQHLLYLRVYFFQVNTSLPGEPLRPKKKLLIWDQSCLKNSA